jgi:hypothetical protein
MFKDRKRRIIRRVGRFVIASRVGVVFLRKLFWVEGLSVIRNFKANGVSLKKLIKEKLNGESIKGAR